jgi:MFS family permease
MAVGSLSAALLSARRHPRLRVLVVALVGFTVSTFLLATAPTFELFAIYLVPTGLAALTALTTANALVQMSVSPVMRGRVMALYMAIFLGGTPLGAPMIGWIGDAWGARWTIAIGTITVGLSVVAVAVWFARRHNVAVTFQTQHRPRLRVRLDRPATAPAAK